MATRALVLGGGGPIGVGWESGLAAGLEEQGVRVADADLIVGTSAGSVVGSQLALGRAPQDLLAVQRALSEGDHPAYRSLQRDVDTKALMESFRRWFSAENPGEDVRAEIGAFALSAKTVTEDEWLPTFGRMGSMSYNSWPERSFACTAIDTADGRFVTWEKDSGVPLRLAVASSCAVPGLYPPVTIDGRRYMDGGMRSSTNADLAKGYDIVLVVSVTLGLTSAARADIAERARRRLDEELAVLREAGSTVELIAPDAASLEAFGGNLLDPSRRGQAAEAGLRQGRAEAARLRDFWK